MIIYLKDEKLKELKEDLFELNKSNKIPNNFIRLKRVGKDNYIVTTLVNKKSYAKDLGLKDEIFYNNSFKFNIFNKRDNYIALVNEDFIEVNTSAELHLHSGYSLLDGMIRLNDLAKKSDYACALTDHGVMYGCLDFYKKMKAEHKKPIIGFEAYTENIDGARYKFNKANRKSIINNHLVLLAKNEIGYKNICKINSLAQKDMAENNTNKPRVRYSWLRKYSKGIICLTACLGGELPKAILSNDENEIRRVIENFINIFGKENFYLEVQRHNIPQEEYVLEKMKELSKEYGLKMVATVDAHYLNKDDKLTHEAQLCLQRRKKMSDTDRWVFPGEGYYYHTSTEKETLFSDCPEALINTLEIVDKCQFEYEFGNYKLPKFPLPKGVTEEEYFTKLCLEGFNERFPAGTVNHTSKEYKERLQFEIETINRMGYPSYFLIVWDFIKYARDNGIGVGPGRGSACGSLASYCLRITDMNPLKYDLLFERFLNPDRISMPDIDIDINNLRREEVINYCREKYGADAVSKIITFGTSASKNSILDTARVWEKSVEFARSISDKIPSAPKMTIKKALNESIELKEMYDNNEEARDIIDKAMKIEGLPRNTSTHACGVIICKSDVTDYCPQIYELNEETGLYEGVTQITMSECEEIGLLKMDFLGLKTMTVLQYAIDDINRIYGENLTIEDIPLDDPKVYEFIAKGHTKGVFQLEGDGMTSFMKDLFQDVHNHLVKLEKENANEDELELAYRRFGAELFERVIAGISLYRPGPIGEIPNYIKGMLNKNEIHYDTPELESILNTTYGVVVYQEQAMTATRELAGFSKGQADTIRKGMSKKKEEILNEYGEYFIYGSDKADKYKSEDKKLNIKGCISLGIDEEVAIKIWKKLKAFGEYALIY